MSADLRIALLGPLIVTRGGQPIPDSAWRSRQDRRLLGMLLAARGAHVSAERLIDWLWPDTPPEAAAITLRSAISGLRRTLESGGARASTRYILTQPGGYAWNAASGAWIDVEEFLALTTADHRPLTADDRRTAKIEDRGWRIEDRGVIGDPLPSILHPRTSRLEQALALYRGELLADEPNAPWAARLRETLRERFLSAVAELAELRIADGALPAALDLAERGLEHERLREPLHRALMEAHARMGDVAGALRAYERYRRLLDEELGASPAPQTQALHAAILRGEVADDRRPTTDDRRPSARRQDTDGRPSVAAVHSRQHTPFVGRAAELAALRGWVAELGERRGGSVALVGEAGIGKTRLAEEALRIAEDAGALAIRLRCAPLERDLPFAPLGEALRPLVRAAPDATLLRLPSAALAQAAELLPALRERLPDLPLLPDAPPAERRNRMIEGLVGLALALARHAPLVICCDDAQWADEATLAALGRLARHAPRHALLLILAYRAEELTENQALHTLLRTLGREMLLHPLLLYRFDDGEVAQFLAELAQAPPDQVAWLTPHLTASSGGNPLFLSVAVQSLLEARGAPSLAVLLPDLPAGAALPDLAGAPRIRDLVLGRVERLPAPARDLLEQIAVIGRPVSLDLIEQLGGAPALAAAQILLERHLLIEDLDGRLLVGHDLVRSIVAGAVVSPRRRLLHRQAADAIAALHGARPERAAELAFHYNQAGQGADAAVLRYAVIAGDAARRAFGFHAALGHYDAALRAAERLGTPASQAEVYGAFAGRLRTCEALLDWDGMIATAARYERWSAGRAAHPSPSPPPMAGVGIPQPLVAPRRLVLLRALMGDLAGAAALSAEQARRHPEATPAIQDMLRRTAIILQPVEPTTDHRRPTTTDKESYDTQHTTHNTQHPFPRSPPPPGAPAEDLPALLGPDDAALALFQVGWAALMQGLLRDAEPCLLRSYELAGETGQAAVAVVGALQLAHLNDLRGDGAATARWLETSLDLARRAPEAAWASIWPLIHEGFLMLLDDRHEQARVRFEAMAAQLQDLPAFQSHRASVEVGLGLLALARGDLAQAEGRLAGALRSPQLLYGFVYTAAQHGLARGGALRGDLPTARVILGHTLDYSARRGLLPEYIRTAIEVARIERDYGDPARSLALLRAAADLAAGAELGPLAVAARALLGRLAG
jgi:DNA-binding SARP family transcriptional activator